MDEEERFSASSPESERENEPEEVMEDEPAEPENDDHNEENNDEDDDDGEQDEANNIGTQSNDGQDATQKKSSSPQPQFPSFLRPTVRPEYITARLYDIVPTMAAPQSTSVNAMAITPDLRYWFTGGSDGYIRKYDGPGTINGKLALTVAQKHPFVDSVTKAGILMSYWENEEPSPPGTTSHEQILSPVYSLAVESTALWLLSGLESGAINLQSVRHDEGKKICSLQRHTNAVSVLTMAPDEKSVLSGSWDKTIFDWDLNTGQTIRGFTGTAGQISAVELRPECGDPVPADADEPPPHMTMTTNAGPRLTNGFASTNGVAAPKEESQAHEESQELAASPAHESLFGGSDAGSLFGETTGGQAFAQDDDEFGGSMGMMTGQEGGMDHSADMAMASMDMEKEKPAEEAPAAQEQSAPGGDAMDIDPPPVKQEGQEAAKTEPAEDHAQGSSTQRTDDATDISATQPTQADALPGNDTAPKSPTTVSDAAAGKQRDQSQTSTTTFLASAMDGTIRIWDRRVPNAVARITPRAGVPPWCMSACWSPDGNMIYAGRRNGTVEEYDVRKARRGWEPERVLKFPAGSGAVSAVKPMVNGRHLICASHDIMRLYDLQDRRAFKHSTVPFLIIPGPPRAGVISSLYIDPTSRFMLSAAGTRGWNGTSTEVLVGYEISVMNS
ncbi:transcription factor [Cordyceps fumosorosea ARSEF 2679]|uniref:Transcription factor n=1 Tax=Cordyceps fumosorosea (strain ARSEF 2679) TaxID=1081104 RepID=A0A167N3V3_CORFA|nr:transcription factor [Cordyceps fumosorosea ARSEF 2679]OAA55099.1 transcription factor [Cordyceps fumosorosea ARSEF 2679]